MRNFPSNDEEYDSLLTRIQKGAEYLDNPLIKPKDYNKGMALYDELCQAARLYRSGGRQP